MHSDKDSQYEVAFAIFYSDISYTHIFWCLANLKSAISYKWLTIKVLETLALFCFYH